jgi:hypothetical protein
MRHKKIVKSENSENLIHWPYAAMGIRTPVAGVKGPHDWPDYTIAARCCFM